MKQTTLFLLLALLISWACNSEQASTTETVQTSTLRIAFGSCAHEDQDQPLLNIASGLAPDLFIYLGDNIYGDTRNMDTLRAKYNKLGAKPEFQNLSNQTKILSVWDDHDFGENDAGRHYPFKEASKEIFMDFWKVPANSDRRQHEGIYGVEYFENGGKKIQVVLLDTRTFRDDLIHRTPEDSIIHKNDYIPNQNQDSTFLGETQWQWLEQQFLTPADIRIIASSNQFSHEYNGWESWTNVPHEQQKMISLIKKTKANGVIFISGDVHWGEISKMPVEASYPIYDVTSSGITQTWDIIEPNKNRVGPAIAQNNIGLIEITTKDSISTIELAIVDSTAQKVAKHLFPLKDICHSN
ncbi:MAG: alkaline phosphatase family protein [Chitinophagales bacterium]|nr:alkaline phosphatase family protein [Chitinophagales bacterium]